MTEYERFKAWWNGMTERERFEAWWNGRFGMMGPWAENAAWAAWQAARWWIPVAEQSPESEVLVMCYDWGTEEFYFGHKIGNYFESSGGYIFRVTHWLPVPELPEEE